MTAAFVLATLLSVTKWITGATEDNWEHENKGWGMECSRQLPRSPQGRWSTVEKGGAHGRAGARRLPSHSSYSRNTDLEVRIAIISSLAEEARPGHHMSCRCADLQRPQRQTWMLALWLGIPEDSEMSTGTHGGRG